MKSPITKIIVIAIWFIFLTCTIVGLRLSDATITFRWSPLVIGGLILLGGLIWLVFNRLRYYFIRPFKQLSGQATSFTNILTTPGAVRLEVILILLVLALFPWLLKEKYINVAIDTGIYVILALGLNIVVGLAGLLVLGYAGFFAIGAYTYALASIMLNCPFWLGLPLGAVITGLFGLLVGLPSLRLRGDYLAIVTLGFGEVIRYLLKNLPALTGGEKGLPNELFRGTINHPRIGHWLLSQPMHYYYLTCLMVILTVLIIGRLNNSRIGRAWIAIREDELAATAVGINATRMKILAFILSAVWAGLAGVLYAAKMNYITPENFRFEHSALILAMVILGGMGNTVGVILGAIILYILPWVIRDQFPAFQDYRLLIYGATMIIMMLFRPQGLIGSKRRKVELKPLMNT